jgi:nucleotidyltransferase substrate binding protein (TIGR01987 family)
MSLELSSLESAVGALSRALGVTADKAQWQALTLQVQEAVNAGIIQSFEVAYEQSWKMVKRWLENNVGATDVDGVTRRHLFRLAAEAGLISDVDLWMTFHKARNETSHTYNCEIAASVLAMAPDFLAACEALVATLSTRND